ncbi:hypothetical protein [Microcoleus sp.]|uniref:hypothetical protein n=1 Tax=Microcoleus sp. TaxID=44472 RepID=UPI0035930581
MKSTLCSPQPTATQSNLVDAEAIDACTALAWIELIALDDSTLTGDDWLVLCDDIDTGEIYRGWFLWHDREVSGNWEAYDHLSDRRKVAKGKVFLKAAIDSIEDARNQSILDLVIAETADRRRSRLF